jgi:hypothetical protein
MTKANAICNSPTGPRPNLPLVGGWIVDSDGRIVQLTLNGVDPPFTFYATVESDKLASITGIIASRFGIVEPASGQFFLPTGGQALIGSIYAPEIQIDTCDVYQLVGRF